MSAVTHLNFCDIKESATSYNRNVMVDFCYINVVQPNCSIDGGLQSNNPVLHINLALSGHNSFTFLTEAQNIKGWLCLPFWPTTSYNEVVEY